MNAAIMASSWLKNNRRYTKPMLLMKICRRGKRNRIVHRLDSVWRQRKSPTPNSIASSSQSMASVSS